jgi:O-antigen/teichoic acid export membrane protein
LEFGKHIGKGLWAFADKALPALYGLGFIFLVVRVLPQKDFGEFTDIQTIFVFASTLGFSLALQPLTKYAAEIEDNGPFIAASLTISALFIVIVSVIIHLFKPMIVPLLDRSGGGNLSSLMNYLPLLFLTSFYRTFAVSLLQATYQVKKIFWIDAVYLVGVLVLVYGAQLLHHFSDAEDVIILNVIAQSCSSLLALFMTREMMSVKLRLRRDAFTKMWDFGKYNFWGSTMYSLFSQMDVFFVSSFAGVVALATYQAAKVFTRLNDMMSQVIQMFLLPFSSKAQAENETEKMTVVAEKTICFSTLIFIPLFLVLFFFPLPILHLLYNGKYDSGANILRLLSFLALIIPWNAVVSSYLVGTGRVKQGLYSGIALAAVSLASYAILTPMYGALGTAVGFVLSMLVITIGLVLYIRTLIPLRIINIVRRTRDAWTFVRTKIRSS